jgi:hypothetical protein
MQEWVVYLAIAASVAWLARQALRSRARGCSEGACGCGQAELTGQRMGRRQELVQLTDRTQERHADRQPAHADGRPGRPLVSDHSKRDAAE